MKNLTLLQEEEHKITDWLKENGYTDGCLGAAFIPIECHQGRYMDFEYNGNIEDLDVEELAADITANVLDDRFSVRVSTYDGIGDKEFEILHKYEFIVEIWLNE